VIGRRLRRGALWPFVAFGALLAFAGAPAQAELRPLEVPATSGWQHAATGLILRSQLAGYRRTSLDDGGTAELDVIAGFSAPDQSTIVTVYLFRPALMSVPVWFDRSDTQILLREEYRGPQPVAETRAFAPPSASVASGLRRTYTTGTADFPTTGLAIMPMGEWLVAVRISSHDPDPAALETSLDAVIAAIGWPDGVEDGAPATLVASCPTPLKYARRAKLQPPSMVDALMGAALMGVIEEKRSGSEPPADARPVVFCRDAPGKAEFGVYRNAADLDRESYWIAIGDAGRIVSVAPSLGAVLNGDKAYMLSFGDLDRTLVFPNFDKLASPERALEAVTTTSPISSTARGAGGGSTITISTDAK